MKTEKKKTGRPSIPMELKREPVTISLNESERAMARRYALERGVSMAVAARELYVIGAFTYSRNPEGATQP